ncbi:MAG: UDP-glucose 4-epimerase GalE [Planctomycetes bacterium]|nr:UDP-glucose 4-epimerase GalE [Planctomycetota bacterium]MBU1517480.1 UDP-glucose 4-epimerase GalE [Planctomycetota bacterium]MBU2458588.1 UDP-glucose 4-epimerase GalE [Planctomycetota bacterium]MBU2596058.1 UDP-glucose 4-epimerase GalE [Planctomycetota bacterium]
MNVLICGGAGYIGSNMTAMLAQAGHKPIVFDNLSNGHKQAIKGFDFIEGDLADLDLLVKVLKENKIDAVMHFAAFIEAGESVKKPLEFYSNNVCNTQMLLAAMEKCGVKKFVFSSSAAVYGAPDKTPITEDAPKNPINPYGHTKLAVEQMCRFQSQTIRLRYAALRYFNAAGAGANGTLGEDHKPESHLIPLVIAAAMGKREDVKIFGTDYPTPDGTCVRDYIHIEDLCSAHLLALEKLENQNELVYNLGNGKGYSVRDVIETVKKVTGKNFKVTEVPRRPGDPPVLTADATRAIKELGWKVKYPELEKIVETAWQWHNDNPEGYK